MVEQDNDSTRAIYGRDRAFRPILSGRVAPPKSTLRFMKAVADTGRAAAIAELREDKSKKDEGAGNRARAEKT